MLHPSTKKLIDKLQEMTSASKIDWREGDDGTCYYDTEGYRVTIAQTPSRLVLQDAGGRVLETASDTLLSGTVGDDGSNYAMKVDQMVSDARRQLTGSPAIIDQIVSALDLDGDGVPDVDQSSEEVEQTSEAESFESPGYPGQTEMASRVAMLAESVNTDSVSVPPSAEPDGDDDLVAEEAMAEGSDTSEEMPVEASETQTVDESLGNELEATPDAEYELPVEPVSEAEPEQVEAVEVFAEAEPVEEQPVSDIQDEAPVEPKDAVSALAGGLTGAATGFATSQLAENSGMTEPETGSGEAWTVPEAAEAGSTSEEMDFASDDIEPAEAGMVTQYSPTAAAGAEDVEAEAPALDVAEPEEAATSSSEFGSIGAFGATDDAAAPEPEEVSEPEPEAELAEAVIQPATSWGEAARPINAEDVVPGELVDAAPEDISADASDAEDVSIDASEDESVDVDAFASDEAEDDTDVDQYISAAESEVSEMVGNDAPEPSSPVRTGGLASGLAGTPYVTGLGRVGHADAAEPEAVEVSTETVSDATDDLEVTTHDITEDFTETNLEPPIVEAASETADFVSESEEIVASDSPESFVTEVNEATNEAFSTTEDVAPGPVETMTETVSAPEVPAEASVPDFGAPELSVPQVDTPEESGNLMAEISETLTDAGETAEETVSEVADTAFAAVAEEAPMDAVSDKVEEASDDASDAVDSMASAAEEQLGGVTSSVGGFGTAVAEEAREAAETVSEVVEDVTSDPVERTPEPQGLSGHVEVGIQNATEAVSGAFETAAPEASSDPETETVSETDAPAEDTSFASALAGGVSSAATTVVNEVSDAAQSVVDTVSGPESSEEDAATDKASEDEPKKDVFKYNPWM